MKIKDILNDQIKSTLNKKFLITQIVREGRKSKITWPSVGPGYLLLKFYFMYLRINLLRPLFHFNSNARKNIL